MDNFTNNKEVYWDSNEKTIGILGLAPYATANFYQCIIDATTAKKDWEHIRVLIDNNPKIPSRGRCLELGETNPSPYIRDAIIRLHKYGADFVIIPCNTAHYFYDEFTKDLEIHVPNMIEETSKYIVKNFENIQKIGLLSSRTTVKYHLYEKFLSPFNIKLITLPEEQNKISEIIEQVKIGNDGVVTKKNINVIINKLILKGAEGIIVGCTELSLIINERDFSIPIFDSNKILAKICVELAQSKIS